MRLLFILFTSISISASAQISSIKSPTFNHKVNEFFILFDLKDQSKNFSTTNKIIEKLQKQFEKNGLHFSWKILDNGQVKNETELQNLVSESGAQAIMLISLADKVTTVTPVNRSPQENYLDMLGLNTVNVVHHYSLFEINLKLAEEDHAVWRSRMEINTRKSIETKFSKTLIKLMDNDGII